MSLESSACYLVKRRSCDPNIPTSGFCKRLPLQRSSNLLSAQMWSPGTGPASRQECLLHLTAGLALRHLLSGLTVSASRRLRKKPTKFVTIKIGTGSIRMAGPPVRPKNRLQGTAWNSTINTMDPSRVRGTVPFCVPPCRRLPATRSAVSSSLMMT